MKKCQAQEGALWRRDSPKDVFYQCLKMFILFGSGLPRYAVCAAKCAAELDGFFKLKSAKRGSLRHEDCWYL